MEDLMSRKLMLSSIIILGILMSACGAMAPAPSTLVPQVATVVGTAIVPITGAGTATPGAPSIMAVNQNSNLGPILVDSRGMTLYLYTMDTANTSTCYNSCSTVWSPYLTDGMPTAGSGVTASMLGTTTRTDGSTQVTYNGHPLYYFAMDKGPGDTTGEGVQNVWYVITPQGTQK
jgi:predicted lipoprotein with Yx(FWY)xxD motif